MQFNAICSFRLLSHHYSCTNAGLAAYATWRPSLRVLQEAETPCLATDFSEEAALLAAEEARSAGCSNVAGVALNCFRRPLSSAHEEVSRLPACGNGWVFSWGAWTKRGH